MAEETKTLDDLKDLAEGMAKSKAERKAESKAESKAETASEEEGGEQLVDEPAPLPEPKIDEHGRSYATGKRKNAVARVWLKMGSGKVTVNGRDVETFFARPVLRMVINQPFTAAEREGQFDVVCRVSGGGLSGQAGALRHGISRALALFEPALRPPLKKGGFLTRDARVVERKKYGKRKARRSFQFSKR